MRKSKKVNKERKKKGRGGKHVARGYVWFTLIISTKFRRHEKKKKKKRPRSISFDHRRMRRKKKKERKEEPHRHHQISPNGSVAKRGARRGKKGRKTTERK